MVKNINKKIKTIIISIDISEEDLYKRLRKYDRDNVKRGEKPAWVELYENIQKKDFKKPTKKEADYLLVSKQGQEEKTLKRLSYILKEGEKPRKTTFTSRTRQILISTLVSQHPHETSYVHP